MVVNVATSNGPQIRFETCWVVGGAGDTAAVHLEIAGLPVYTDPMVDLGEIVSNATHELEST